MKWVDMLRIAVSVANFAISYSNPNCLLVCSVVLYPFLESPVSVKNISFAFRAPRPLRHNGSLKSETADPQKFRKGSIFSPESKKYST